MENLNKYMNSTSTISSIRERVQSYVDKKETYLSLEKLSILSIVNINDDKKISLEYKKAIDRNDLCMDLIIDVKNEVFKLKLLKESLDRNTQIGINQIRTIDNFISILNDILNIMYEEKYKLDRIVRFYEKSFSYFNNY